MPGFWRAPLPPTPCRANTLEQNLAMWEEMKKASPEGLQICLRAKLSVDNPNKALRDPVIYRCNLGRGGTAPALGPLSPPQNGMKAQSLPRCPKHRFYSGVLRHSCCGEHQTISSS